MKAAPLIFPYWLYTYVRAWIPLSENILPNLSVVEVVYETLFVCGRAPAQAEGVRVEVRLPVLTVRVRSMIYYSNWPKEEARRLAVRLQHGYGEFMAESVRPLDWDNVSNRKRRPNVSVKRNNA